MRSLAPLATLSVLYLATNAAAQAWPPTSIEPDWASQAPTRIISVAYDGSRTSAENGQELKVAIQALLPGEGLAIGPGTYSIDSRFDVSLAGTVAEPIWIYGSDSNDKPVITRSNAQQNVMNVGDASATQFVCFRDIEFTGGSYMITLYEVDDFWIDRCYLHDGGDVGISASRFNNSRLYITRNEIKHPGRAGTKGEALYLGTGSGAVKVSYSVIAENHIHSTLDADDGDGIELKQGSHHNWIVGNHVHDTNYPGILVYGTAGNGQNIVEGNLVYNSNDVALQVQGEAIVRNNVAVNGAVAAFSSHRHADTVRDFVVTHNTFVSPGIAAQLNNWDGANNLTFANNVCYSETDFAMRFGQSTAGVNIVGNVIHGTIQGPSTGFVAGTGLGDFADGSWDASQRDFTPTIGGPIDNRASAAYPVADDLLGTARGLPADPGATENARTLVSNVNTFAVGSGGTQQLRFNGGNRQAGQSYTVLGSFSGTATNVSLDGFDLPLMKDAWTTFTVVHANSSFLQNTVGTLDPNGSMVANFSLPGLPNEFAGITFHHAVSVWDNGQLEYISNPVSLQLR